MWSSILPKCKPKITRISALPNKQGSQPKNCLHTLTTKKSPTEKGYDPCLYGRAEILFNFWFAFWEKRLPHEFILNLTDHQQFVKCYTQIIQMSDTQHLSLRHSKEIEKRFRKSIRFTKKSQMSNKAKNPTIIKIVVLKITAIFLMQSFHILLPPL